MAKGVRYTAESNILEELGLVLPEPTPLPPGLLCSFCRRTIPDGRATYGQAPPRFYSKGMIFDDDRHSFEDIIGAGSDKIVACPDCSLRVEKVTFPAFD